MEISLENSQSKQTPFSHTKLNLAFFARLTQPGSLLAYASGNQK